MGKWKEKEQDLKVGQQEVLKTRKKAGNLIQQFLEMGSKLKAHG